LVHGKRDRSQRRRERLEVIGYDIEAARRAELATASVMIASDVVDVARNAAIIMTSLPSPAAVEDVARAIANSGQPKRIVVELSTLAIADKLRFEAILKQAGHIALDSPLSGTGAQAKQRDLFSDHQRRDNGVETTFRHCGWSEKATGSNLGFRSDRFRH
jgi:3-hydroxyisobutyrate dehydrogenase-like beta-hydroxyacid dehydrogenase